MSEVLRIDGLSVEIDGRRVVDAVSLHVAAGEVVAVVGPSGSGKTTTLRAALGLHPSAVGAVRVGDVDVRTLDGARLARAIAYVPQRSQLEAALPVHDVVAHGRFAFREGSLATASSVNAALALVGVPHLATRLFTTLSGGERARVLVARALASSAPALLLDEPTSALDVGTALRLLDTLREVAAAGRAVLVVLHDLEQARRCDRVVVLSAGRVVASGPPDDAILAAETPLALRVSIRPQDGLRCEPTRAPT